MTRIFATNFWCQQNPALSTVYPPPISTFSRAGSAYRHFPVGDETRLEEVANDVLRCSWQRDVDTGLWICGAHLEPDRENLAAYNTDIAGSGWSNTGCSQGNAILRLPTDATSVDDMVYEDASTGPHYTSISCGALTAAVYTLSCFFHAAARERVRLFLDDGTQDYLDINFVTGLIYATSGGVIDSAITSLGNGWHRAWFSRLCSTAVCSVGVAVLDDDGNASFTGEDRGSVVAYGMQLELGDYPTSLIVTGATSTTRAADNDWSVAAPLPDARQGWITGRIYHPLLSAPSVEIPILTLSDGGGATDRIRLAINTSGNLEVQSVCSGGDAGLASAGSIINTGQKGRQYYATWRPDELCLALDGVFGTSDHVVSVPDNLDTLELHPCGGIIGDIQMANRFSRVPWRHVAAEKSSIYELVDRGLDALSTSLTINGQTITPYFLYRGRDATTDALIATIGTDMPKYERGTNTTPGENIAIAEGLGEAVGITHLGDHYALTSGVTWPGTDDFVIEMVFEAGPAIGGYEKYPLSNYPAGFSCWCNVSLNDYRFWIGPQCALFTAIAGMVYHVMIFADRSGYLQGYYNNTLGGSMDITSVEGQDRSNGKLSIGGGGAWANKTENFKLAWMAGWMAPSGWLDSHLQPALVEVRYNQIFNRP